jgi:hypothetical protein
MSMMKSNTQLLDVLYRPSFMYQRSSSQMVDAMNNANKRMRVRVSVDVVNATILLLAAKNGSREV